MIFVIKRPVIALTRYSRFYIVNDVPHCIVNAVPHCTDESLKKLEEVWGDIFIFSGWGSYDYYNKFVVGSRLPEAESEVKIGTVIYVANITLICIFCDYVDEVGQYPAFVRLSDLEIR